jgi:polyribonucleotide nucleotidyltransferase
MDWTQGLVVRRCTRRVLVSRDGSSSFFRRGDTSALCTATLGSEASQRKTSPVVGPDTAESFMLHYDFMPYAVNETGAWCWCWC